ncbi:MAG: RidA family protein [Chloroflexi bacterium]|nr:RidA family protein [Chloroflexota bacterium]
MAERRTARSGTPWESQVGYARAVRIGNHISVSGTTASDEHGQLAGGADAEAQATYILRKIERALLDLDATLADVVRTRIYVTNIDDWPAVGRAHRAAFAAVEPAATLVQVVGLVGGRLVEIEADAIVSRSAST